MLTFSVQQMRHMASAAVSARADDIAALIQRDFSTELSGVNATELRQRVNDIVIQYVEVGFSSFYHVYHLTAWALLLGEDFFEKWGDGAVGKIMRAPLPVDEKFDRIRACLMDGADG